MSEFPVSSLEKRLSWGIICAVGAMLLNLGTPLLLMGIGISPNFHTQQGPYSGMGVAILAVFGFVISGSAGFIAGLARPGTPSIIVTLICLVLIDACMMATSMWLYFISAAIKVVLILAVIDRKPLP